MTGQSRGRNMGANLVTQIPLTYLSGEAMTVDGLATVPSEANYVAIAAEGGAVYYAINSAIVTVSSPGYCPDAGWRLEGPIENLDQLSIHLASGATAHIEYFVV